MDILVISSFIIWIFDDRDWVLLITTFLFYILRSFIFLIFQLRYPIGYSFFFPNFISITVSYLVTNDFFFSGHIGLTAILAFYYYKKKQTIMVCFSAAICLIEAITMVLVRGHYSLDMVYGILFGHYVFKIAVIIHPMFKNLFKIKDHYVEIEEEDNHKKGKYIIINDPTLDKNTLALA